MHPNFVVYNPETMLRLKGARARHDRLQLRPEPHVLAAGWILGGGDSRAGRLEFTTCTRRTAKSTARNTAVNGVLDVKERHSTRFHRSWIFRTVGYGYAGRVVVAVR